MVSKNPLSEKKRAHKLYRPPAKLWRTFRLMIRVKMVFLCVIEARAQSAEDFMWRILMPMLRRVVSEEIEKGINKSFSQVPRPIDYNMRPRFKLCFLTELKDIYTILNIKGKNGIPIQISMLDTHGKTVKLSPFASAKVKIVALHGNFCADGRETWSKDEFERSIVSRRNENKEALLDGDLEFELENGTASICNAHFTDISKWARGGKFRLGVKLIENVGERVQEGISNPFIVKHYRGKANEKVDNPSLEEEVWRLKKIAKDGDAHKKLKRDGISTVGGLLESFHKDESKIKKILGRTWEITIKHAKEAFPSDNMLRNNLPYGEYSSKGLDETMQQFNLSQQSSLVSVDIAREQPQTGHIEINIPAPPIVGNYYHGSSSSQPDPFDHLMEPLHQAQVAPLEAVAEDWTVHFDEDLYLLEPDSHCRLKEIQDELSKALNGESVQFSLRKWIKIIAPLKWVSIAKKSAARRASPAF